MSPAPLVAQQPAPQAEAAAPLDASYALPNACYIIVVRPGQVFRAPSMALLPMEVIQAAVMQETGVDPLTAEQVLMTASPPTVGPPGISFHAKFSAPVALKLDQLPMRLVKSEVAGRTIYRDDSGNPMQPSLYLPDDRNIVLADGGSIGNLPTDAAASRGPLLTQFVEAYQSDDLLAMFDMEPLRPLVAVGLAQDPPPPEFAEFIEIPNLVKTIKLRLNLSHPGVSELVVAANNERDADRLTELADKARGLISAQMNADVQRQLASDDPVEQASGRYMQRMMNYWNGQLQFQRDSEQIILFRTDGQGGNELTNVAIIGVLVGLLLPAVQAAREAARRTSSMNNIKMLNLGLLNHESARGNFPAYANFTPDGKPLLSWRVHLLPFMEQQALYQQFHLDEPWDSPHNKALIPQMPAYLLDPSSQHAPAEGLTHYLGSKGEGQFFDGTAEGRQMRDITDGTSNTITVVQVNDDRVVPWTQPEDWEFDAATPMAGVGGLHAGGIFLAGFADGHVVAISTTIDPNMFKALVTAAGGEVINNVP